MNYEKIYESIIDRGLVRIENGDKGKYQKHRIVPNHENGKYINGNVTLLTRKEHRIVHKLRYKLYGKWQDKCASILMGGNLSDKDWNFIRKCGSIKGGISSGNMNKLLKRGICGRNINKMKSDGNKGGTIAYNQKLGIHGLSIEDHRINQLLGVKAKMKKPI